MATIITNKGRPISFLQTPLPPMGPHEATGTPGYSAGSGDEVDARTHQLSLLVEVNAALAGALDVESVLGTILSRLADRERLSHARIYRLDETAGELQPVAWGGGMAGPARHVVQDPRRRPGNPAPGAGIRPPHRSGPALPGVQQRRALCLRCSLANAARGCWELLMWRLIRWTASAR